MGVVGVVGVGVSIHININIHIHIHININIPDGCLEGGAVYVPRHGYDYLHVVGDRAALELALRLGA
jgi:hypothetical protein